MGVAFGLWQGLIGCGTLKTLADDWREPDSGGIGAHRLVEVQGLGSEGGEGILTLDEITGEYFIVGEGVRSWASRLS
jgi:hypothetical protein